MPRFTLTGMLLATFVVAIFCAAFCIGGDAGTSLAFLGAVNAVWLFHRQTGRLNLLGAIAIVLFVTGLSTFIPSQSYSRVSNRRVCRDHLKQLGLSLLNFEDKHKHFPAVWTVNDQGQPLVSWRVQILPDLECSSIFSRYHKDEPWTAPVNRMLTKSPMQEFHCPGDFGRARQSEDSEETSYVAIIGPCTAWTPGHALRLSEITDSVSNTILLIEMKHSDIAWAEPRDLDLENLPPGVTTNNLLESIAVHPGIVNVVFADCHVAAIPTDTPWSDFYAMLTIAGGEKIDTSHW